MKKFYRAILVSFFFAMSGQDGVASETTGLSPHPKAIFFPLRGDPRELHFALRGVIPSGEKFGAEVAVGGYYGIYRWPFFNDGSLQINIGGGIFPRFDFFEYKFLQVIDFYGNIPIDLRMSKWSGRFMLYHVSSHLGDDYLRETGLIAERNSWNSLRSIASYDASRFFRLYGGYSYHFLVHPPEQKRHAYQGGFELASKVFGGGRAQAYWANDLQGWQRSASKPTFNSQVGIKTGREPRLGRGVTYFVEFTTGPENYGQFFNRHETRTVLGLKFDI